MRKYNYENFYYEQYSIEESDRDIHISFNFSIDGLATFNPTLTIDKKKFKFLNSIHNETTERIVFCMGMVELISYWKCVCPPNIHVRCVNISTQELLWWKKLYFYGLGEFFYTNNITPDFDSFVNIICSGDNIFNNESYTFNKSNIYTNIIPVGGGKDSIVSLELLSSQKKNNLPLIINPRHASLYSAYAAGYRDCDILTITRTIDNNLLELNKKGFLNGHTPFSAMLGFTSLLVSYLLGVSNIVLSNEASANESTVPGTNINHQYSKSFEFELDFANYIQQYISPDIRYFSLLRPLSEIRIAKLFSRYEKYYPIFKSCNVGSKTDVWCSSCPKCLFVYIMLLAFIEPSKLQSIFGKDMLDDASLVPIFRELVGMDNVKPFECVGTIEEVNVALNLIYNKHYKNSDPPYLLKYYQQNYTGDRYTTSTVLTDFNRHNIPDDIMSIVGDIYD